MRVQHSHEAVELGELRLQRALKRLTDGALPRAAAGGPGVLLHAPARRAQRSGAVGTTDCRTAQPSRRNRPRGEVPGASLKRVKCLLHLKHVSLAARLAPLGQSSPPSRTPHLKSQPSSVSRATSMRSTADTLALATTA